MLTRRPKAVSNQA